jgi:flavodoxin
MKSVVIYASRYGNTRKLAEAIAEALNVRGEAQLIPADEATMLSPEQVDLVVIGGPTEMHRMTRPVVELFDGIARGSLRGVAAAAFDTRYHAARWLTGSAAVSISRRLRGLGARMIAPEESFFVTGKADPSTGEAPELVAGELERASVWATSLANKVAASVPGVLDRTR